MQFNGTAPPLCVCLRVSAFAAAAGSRRMPVASEITFGSGPGVEDTEA